VLLHCVVDPCSLPSTALLQSRRNHYHAELSDAQDPNKAADEDHAHDADEGTHTSSSPMAHPPSQSDTSLPSASLLSSCIRPRVMVGGSISFAFSPLTYSSFGSFYKGGSNAALSESARVNGETGKSKSRTKKRKATIASIRLFVDPRLAERVYSALELPLLVPPFHPLAARCWWCCEPVGSAAASPVRSSTVPSFAAAMEASATGHAYASPTVRTFGEVMEGVAEAAASSSFAGFAGTFGRRGHQERKEERVAAHESESDMDTGQPGDACLRADVCGYEAEEGGAGRRVQRIRRSPRSPLSPVGLWATETRSRSLLRRTPPRHHFRRCSRLLSCSPALPPLLLLQPLPIPRLRPLMPIPPRKPKTRLHLHTMVHIKRTRTPPYWPVFVHHARIGAVLLRALKAGMPVSVWERGGDGRLLGGVCF
jgi:hypothetical protein